MIKVGLTGNIGSGKSLVCKAFEALNIPIFYADLEARKILNSPEMVAKIANVFGNEVVLINHEIDRPKLASIVFKAASELEKLNQLIHPQLRENFQMWTADHQEAAYVIQEAAILFENNFNQLMDKVITVSAPLDVRLKRVMDRDNANSKDVLARMKHQWPDGKKEELSDFIIKNDGSEMLLPQVLKIHKELIS
jgi:dephospho-CoA kinase